MLYFHYIQQINTVENVCNRQQASDFSTNKCLKDIHGSSCQNSSQHVEKEKRVELRKFDY